MPLFGRKSRLVVGSVDVSELDMSFRVKKSLKPEPNTLDLEIYNLSDANRKSLATQPPGIQVTLEAGYLSQSLTQIYFGEARAAWSFRRGADVVTALAAGDGEKAAKSRINIPIGPKAPSEQALRGIVAALGVKPGNQEQALALLRTRGFSLASTGGALSGNTQRILTDFCKSAGLEWSIQDGALQVLERGKGTPEAAFVLTSETGLVGESSVDSKGVVQARCLILPDIRPGRVVVFNSEFLQGAYRVDAVEYIGETNGQNWYADIECTQLK